MLKKKTIAEAATDIIHDWNHEFKDSFPLTEELFQLKTTERDCFLEDSSFSLYMDEEYLGAIVLKKSFFTNHRDELYVSFLHIAPPFRNLGYGTRLIESAFRTAHDLGYAKIALGTDESCLFSGVFIDNNPATHHFFQKRGFQKQHNNVNLIASTKPVEFFESDGVIVKYGITEVEKNALHTFVGRHFSERWVDEVHHTPKEDLVVLLKQKTIIGFCVSAFAQTNLRPNSINLYPLFQNLAGIGPLGIDPEERNCGYGKTLVNQTIHRLFDRGASDVMVDWTGLETFYKICGFERVYTEYVSYVCNLE